MQALVPSRSERMMKVKGKRPLVDDDDANRDRELVATSLVLNYLAHAVFPTQPLTSYPVLYLFFLVLYTILLYILVLVNLSIYIYI